MGLLTARVDHPGELPTERDQVIIPQAIVAGLHSAIEGFPNLTAVQFRCGRSISSPAVYAAIEPIDQPAREWLGRLSGIKADLPTAPARMWPNVDLRAHLPLLQDRFDGASILAESLCHSHPSGRLHDLIRVFERAFAVAAGRTCKELLPAFLSGTPYGFTAGETALWLDLHYRSAHADRRPDFALEADTRPVANRAEHAAYDVLFNKAEWRSPSTDRRDVFHPWFASGDQRGTVSVLRKGGDIAIQLQPLDGFGAYPYCMIGSGPITPTDWLVVRAGKLVESMVDVLPPLDQPPTDNSGASIGPPVEQL